MSCFSLPLFVVVVPILGLSTLFLIGILGRLLGAPASPHKELEISSHSQLDPGASKGKAIEEGVPPGSELGVGTQDV